MAYLVSVSVVSLLLLMTTTDTVVCQIFSEEFVNFVSVVSGHYINAGQIGEVVHNVRAVTIPALTGLVTLYMDDFYKGQMTRQVIGIVSEGWSGNFFVSFHNLTDWNKFSAETIDYSDFEYGDISELPQCEAVFVKRDISPNTYTGNFDCYSPDTDDYYGYAATYSCKGIRVIPKGKLPEGHKLVPFYKQTKSYPLPDYLLAGHDDFVDPCADS